MTWKRRWDGRNRSTGGRKTKMWGSTPHRQSCRRPPAPPAPRPGTYPPGRPESIRRGQSLLGLVEDRDVNRRGTPVLRQVERLRANYMGGVVRMGAGVPVEMERGGVHHGEGIRVHQH